MEKGLQHFDISEIDGSIHAPITTTILLLVSLKTFIFYVWNTPIFYSIL